MLLSVLILAALSVPIVAAIAADEPRRIDFTQQLIDADGATFPDDGLCPFDQAMGKRTCATTLTLGRAAFYALRMNDTNIGWDDAVRRDELARSIRDAKDWPLLSNDKDLIRKLMPRLWPPAIIGAANRQLEGR